ncbi:LOW QUALITY PROTEIN: taste receptor type 1 member 1 [Morus bassanus]
MAASACLRLRLLRGRLSAERRPPRSSSPSAATFKSHGYCPSQATRFAAEEINNASALLPSITLGYDIHDTEVKVLPAFRRYEPEVVAVVRPDSARLALTAAAVLSIFLLRSQAELAVQPLRACVGPALFPGAGSWQAAIAAGSLSFKGFSHGSTFSSGSAACPASSLFRKWPACAISSEGAAAWLPLQMSYEASLETLSLKRFYTLLLRTIPSNRQQAKAIFLLLGHFGWTWVALLGSDNTYSRDGLDALYKLLTASDACIAYGIIPVDKDASSLELYNLVRILMDIRVNVTIVFSNRQSARPFSEVVIQRNGTGMVVGSEDWSLAQTIWQVPGIQSISLVIEMLVEKTESTMLERFESWKMAEKSAAAECAGSRGASGGIGGSTQRCTSCHLLTTAPDMYDAQASFNVYSAMYTVAHGLHDVLGCASGVCSEGKVYPWQLLQKIKQVNFTLYKNCISFDANGDILKGYTIIMWNWSGPSWAFNVMGTSSVNPNRLSVDQGEILWHTKDRQILFCIQILFIAYCQASYIPHTASSGVFPHSRTKMRADGGGMAPTLVCSEACQLGEKRLQWSHHRCCFSCTACPSGTFLNRWSQYAPGDCFCPAWLPCPHPASFFCQLLASVLPFPQPLPSRSLFLPVVSKNL